MKWLHFSDIHYNPKEDDSSTLQLRIALPKYIRDQHIQADEIFITGDFRHAAMQKDQDIREAARDSVDFIREIATAAGVNDPAHIHIVPGNHDRTRDASPDRVLDIVKSYNSDAGRFSDDDCQYLLNRFDFFHRVCDELYGEDHAWTGSTLHTYRPIGEYILLSINSAITHENDDSRRNLVIGNYDLTRLLNEIKENHPYTPLIVLAHHALEFLSPDEKRKVDMLFRGYPIYIYLCGDAHEVWCDKINNRVEITVGCLQQKSGVQAVFCYGDTDREYCSAYQWDGKFDNWGPYDHFNQRMKELINLNTSPAKVVTVSRPINPSDFQRGRSNEIKAISDKLKTDETNITLIHGVGGIGKTEICRELFKRCETTGIRSIKMVGWLFFNESMKQTVYGQFTEISAEEQDKESYFRKVDAFLKQHGKEMLLFLDNADAFSQDDIKFLRSMPCNVIMTSRREIDQIRGMKIEPLIEEECRALYQAIIGSNTADETSFIDKIITLADRHTLAVELLAKTQRACGFTSERFLDKLKKEGFDLAGVSKINSSYHIDIDAQEEEQNKVLIEHLAKVFEISQLNAGQLHILKLFSLFPGQAVRKCDDIQKWFELESLDEVNELSTRGWLEQDSSGIMVFIHPVIAAIVQYKARATYEDALKFIKKFLHELGEREGKTISDFNRLLPIAVALAGMNWLQAKNTEFVLLCNNTAGAYRAQGDYSKALEWYQKILGTLERVLGKNHHITAMSYSNIAGVYDDQGDYPKALEGYQRASRILEKVLGKEHPSTAATYNNMAVVYAKQGDFRNALKWYQKALIIRERVLGKEHPDTARVYHNLAGVYNAQGDYAKSLEWYQKALEFREKVLSKNHQDTASTYSNMAGVYVDQGDYPKALEWYQKALEVLERVLGKEHPDTARVYHNLAGVYNAQGDYAKSLEWCQKALKIRERVLGKNHPDTASTYSNMAGVYANQGDYAKSLEWYHKALEIREKVLGENHPSIATTYNNMAGVYANQGDFPNALKWLQKALEIQERVLGKDHPNIALIYNNMEEVYKAQGGLTPKHGNDIKKFRGY